MKWTRLNMSKENLVIFKADPRFSSEICHYFQTDRKHQSKQWKHLSSPPPKEAKTGMSVGKVMASIFRDAEKVLLVGGKGHTITGACLWKGGALPPGPYTVAMAAIQKRGFHLVEDPPYSPDLAPSDYYLFLKMKKELGGHHFTRDGDVMNAVDHFLRDQNGIFYPEEIHLLHDRWTVC